MWLPLTRRMRAGALSWATSAMTSRHPGPGGIDERPRDDLALQPGVDLERGEAPGFVVALGGDAAGAGVDGGAAFGGVDGVEDDEPGIIDPAVGIFESAHEFRLERQRRPGRVARSSVRVGGRMARPPRWS